MTQSIELTDYSIYVGMIWEELRKFLKQHSYSKIFILVDEHTKSHCLPVLQNNIEIGDAIITEIQSGEQHKNIHTCSSIWEKLMSNNADRNALLINLGGGVIGDMGGFCAATYKRGIDFIQVPTTLLSSVDASIGGKLGIDFAEVKNSVGLFKNPQAVFINPDFLITLPEREIRSGFAEIIKHGLVADEGYWQEIIKIEDLKKADWSAFILPSLMIKKRIVEMDPFEQNIRKALNFGHTIGHAFESQEMNSERPLLHGEAIAAGMICEIFLSTRIAGFSKTSADSVNEFILKIFGKYSLKNEYIQRIIRLMKNDKKNKDGLLNFTLLNRIGNAEIDKSCQEALVKDSFSYYQAL